jgi:hypothetical protein
MHVDFSFWIISNIRGRDRLETGEQDVRSHKGTKDNKGFRL